MKVTIDTNQENVPIEISNDEVAWLFKGGDEGRIHTFCEYLAKGLYYIGQVVRMINNQDGLYADMVYRKFKEEIEDGEE